ncbi:ATP-binding cassette domain-containing protein [Cellulomonas endophytica]|uniref:ATP-binding cassette domain-containing protein n=1 Tax=Cellulomonas endophytica TaxID=2494735 RepID=UPI0010122EC9|nr:ATP-binding cassette domain-containing protein [Cellulomonas endophytica]
MDAGRTGGRGAPAPDLAAPAGATAPSTAPATAPSPPAAPVPLLALRQVSKFFGAVEALVAVDLEVHAHEVVALVGDNGAGKSTAAKVIAGVLTPDAGQVEIDGEPVTVGSPSGAHDLGIATVFQDLALCENLDVTANLFLGREVHQGLLLSEGEMETQTRGTLDALSARIPSVRTPLHQLSAGQRQSVAIARTLIGSPRIVVLDEPTASLSVVQTAEVLTHIERLRDLGLGVIIISHNMNDVRAVADRIVVLRHGRVNGTFDAASASYESIIGAITGASHAAPMA